MSLFLSNQSFSTPNTSKPSKPKAVDPLGQCILGFETHATNGQLEDNYFEYQTDKDSDTTLQPDIIQWLENHSWQEGYSLWQNSATEKACQNSKNGYEFLLMHHQMTQTLKSLWPSMNDQFEGWNKFPKDADAYPTPLKKQFHAWPDSVLRAAKITDRIPKMTKEELLSRWKDEGEFAHWILCDSNTSSPPKMNGMNINNIYGALQFNGASTLSRHNLSNPKQQLDSYLFWKVHGWLDKTWMRYRMVLEKKPQDSDFQADLLNQCQIFYSWIEKAKTQKNQTTILSNNAPLYVNGQLNPQYQGKAARLLGEVIEIKKDNTGKIFFKLNLRLKGVNPIWVSGYTKIAETTIDLGDRLIFIGHVKKTNDIDASGELTTVLKTSTLLIARSIQSPK